MVGLGTLLEFKDLAAFRARLVEEANGSKFRG